MSSNPGPGDLNRSTAENPDSSTELTEQSGTGAFAVHSLQPGYNEADHGLYVSYIQAELEKPASTSKSKHGSERVAQATRPRNLALTGSYGSGKSSILSKIIEDFGDRVVSVSLSTLGSEEVNRDRKSVAKDPLETPAITNAIQKEIVKQLLYREKPSNMPGSRYKRIEQFEHPRAIAFSAIVASVLTAVLLVTGWLGRVERFFAYEFWPIFFSYAGLLILILAVVYGLQYLFHNRVRIAQLTSGPASVSLADKTDGKSESYFDKYLDELVYFFEANKYDIVILEDLDRFNDPYIFETLRELNTLLNNSKQIAPNVITFVYAIKDSIFEQLGRLSINGVTLTDAEVQQLAVTNRTKFFDLVIPVVPFISQRNARDLVRSELKKSGYVLDGVLLDLVSRHLVDMRLIKNVHNEFGVFDQKILGENGVTELDRQRLFAMIVHKNLNMADFEKVKEGTSILDAVHADYRALVNQQIAAADSRIRAARARSNRLGSIEARSADLGERLLEHIARTLKQSGSNIDQASMTLSTSVTPAELRTSGFWTNWLDHDSLVLEITYPRMIYTGYYGQQSVSVSLSIPLVDVRAIVRDALRLEDWRAADAAVIQQQIAEDLELKTFLKSASMRDVSTRSDLTVTTANGTQTFVEAAESHLGRGLALDLIRAGYIDRNFSLYASLYYDDTVTARARNFILHAVETNTMDENASIGTTDEIEAMLVDAGESIFEDRAIYNTEIFNYLLAARDVRLRSALRRLALNGQDERRFLDAYFSNGAETIELVKGLSPFWDGILRRLLEDQSLDESQRVSLVDAALANLVDTVSYATTPSLKTFLEGHVSDLSALSGVEKPRSLEAVTRVLLKCDVRFDVLDGLSDAVRAIAVRSSLYKLTRDNLVAALDGAVNLSLDNIRSINGDVYAYVVGHLATYLEVTVPSTETKYSVDDRKNLLSILNDLLDSEVAVLGTVVARAIDGIFPLIGSLNEKLWPVIAGAGRLKPTYANISTYLQKAGSLDASLASSLGDGVVLDLEGVGDSERRDVALILVNSSHLGAGLRAKLVTSLGLAEPLKVSELDLSQPVLDLVGPLLGASVLEDSVAGFSALEPSGWPTQRAYMVASPSFDDYALGISFCATTLQALVEDPATSDEVKLAMVLNMDAVDGSFTRATLVSLAAFGLSAGAVLDASGLIRFARGGVGTRVVVRLIDAALGSLNDDALVAVLSELSSNYKKLTAVGRETKLPNTQEDLRIADRLVQAKRVSSRDLNPSGPDFKVYLKRKLDMA